MVYYMLIQLHYMEHMHQLFHQKAYAVLVEILNLQGKYGVLLMGIQEITIIESFTETLDMMRLMIILSHI